ncbi:MAG: sigma 54-interacting transcriptional regulator [Acidobacteria bacterium]|nr:sigma 54-interacting transcriptional regulator [Acidobacteriota bacterium]
MFQPLYARALLNLEEAQLSVKAASSEGMEAQRAEAILLSAQGRTITEISEALGFHPSNIKKWIRSFNDKGLAGIATRKRGPQGGPRPKFSRSQIVEIISLSKTNPLSKGLEFKEWTPQKLASYAMHQGIVDRISHVTVRQFLKKYEGEVPMTEKPRIMDAMMQRAISYSDNESFLAGKDAFNRSEYEKAVEHLQQVIASPRVSDEEDATARLYLSQSYEELSRFDESFAVLKKYEDAKALANLNPLLKARLKLRIGWAYSWLRVYPEAIASLNDAKKIFLEMQNDSGVCESHYALGRTYIEINEYRIARDHLLTAAKFEGKVYNPELLAQIYSRLGTVDYSEGAFSSAKDNYLKALRYAEGSTNNNLLGMILSNVGTAFLEGYIADQTEAARHSSLVTEYLERAVYHLEKGGHQNYLASAYNNLGDHFLYAGLWTKAIDNLQKAIMVSELHSLPKNEATARVSLAEIQCARGAFQEAEQNLRKSLELVSGKGDKWLESNALRILANVERCKERMDIAIKTLREALHLSTSIGDLHGLNLAQIVLADFHLLQGGYDQAREYIELAQGRLKEEKSLMMSGLIQRLTGKLEAVSGRMAEAKQHIAQSISIFTTTDIPFEIAKSNYEMGLLLIKALDLKTAKTYLLQAQTIFENLAALPDLEKTKKALASLASGEINQPQSPSVAPTSDVLLMQRLIEASASSELLIRELTAVIAENFPISRVIVCKIEGGERLELFAMQGLSKPEAERFVDSLDLENLEKYGKDSNQRIIKMCEGMKVPILLYLSAESKIDISRLQPLLRQAELGLEICSLRSAARGVTPIHQEQRFKTIMPGFIIGSKPMFDVIDKIQKIKTSNVTVLITGESGTGKELVARAIHAESARARAIFLPFNCTATPKEIIDSHLFGHRRGAFTGATENYPGIIRAADGGTLFLDEIGDLSLEVQPKLMRFLQESEIQPLGETRPIRVDVRVLAATNSDLERAVEDGRFRTDLFHRLNIIRIHVPPLRERREEVPILATHFLEHFTSRAGKSGLRLTQDAIDALTAYDWPGNVRQLRNEIERVVAYSYEDSFIASEDLSTEVSHPRKSLPKPMARSHNGYDMNSSGNGVPTHRSAEGNGNSYTQVFERGTKLKQATAALEKQIIQQALERNKNNLSRTALELGLSRRGLRLKLIQLGLSRDDSE